jgi:Family of unknown function (DUF6010)
MTIPSSLLAIEVPLDRMTAPLAVVTVLGACAYVALFSLVREPSRRFISVALLASSASLYYDGKLGIWDKLFWLGIVGCAFVACRWYPGLAIGWLLHTTWDLLSFHAGQALSDNTLRINLHCAIFDPIIATWFVFGAPSVWELAKRRKLGLQQTAPSVGSPTR